MDINNDQESESAENSLPTSSSNSNISSSSASAAVASNQTTQDNAAKVPKTETTEQEKHANTTKLPAEQMPLNVSIRLPDDINERKNLIKRNLEHSDKDTKFAVEIKKEQPLKPEKIEKEVLKEEIVEKYKTELIIPKVVAMDKVVVKEEMESGSGELLNLNSKEESYKDNIFVPMKEQMNFTLKEPHLNHLLSSNHPLNLKETQQQLHDRPKEQQPQQQILNLNHMTYVKEPVYPQNKEPPLSHSLSTVIKLEPHDEPMELTNPNRNEIFGQPMVSQPLNIPTIIPMAQMQQQQQQSRSGDAHFEDEKRIERERTEKLERPERLDRPERTDLGTLGTPIGQPPLPNLMQTGNLVTIGEFS